MLAEIQILGDLESEQPDLRADKKGHAGPEEAAAEPGSCLPIAKSTSSSTPYRPSFRTPLQGLRATCATSSASQWVPGQGASL